MNIDDNCIYNRVELFVLLQIVAIIQIRRAVSYTSLTEVCVKVANFCAQ